MDQRKMEEVELHNRLRDVRLRDDPDAYKDLTSNVKYYSVAQSSMAYFRRRLASLCQGKTVVDFGCGDGRYSFFLAEQGVAKVVGIDISDVSVENCRRKAADLGLSDRLDFRVMDCEALDLEDDSIDVVCEAGVLHHLDLDAAIGEIARVLKPDGRAMCYEAVGHNPLFQLYREKTPNLRTKYETEHILKLGDVRGMKRYFRNVDIRFFHLVSLLGVPFRNLPGFRGLLWTLDLIDSLILRVPGVRSQAWMMVFEMHGEPQPSE